MNYEEKIRAALKKRNMTMKAMCRKLDISFPTFYRIMRGEGYIDKSEPSNKSMTREIAKKRLSKMLGIEIL